MQRRERSAAQSAEITDGVLVGHALAGDERAFESLDALRKRRRRRVVCFSDLEGNTVMEEPAFLAALPDPHPLPEEIMEQHERQHALTQAVQALPSRQRAVVILHYAGQLGFVEIGQVLKMPAMTAKASFYRARPKLAARLMV